MLGLILILLFSLLTLLHPLMMGTVWDRRRFDPIVGYDFAQAPHPTTPNSVHLLGTDNLGRDVLSQLLYSSRVSFGVGILAAAIAVTISTFLGGMAGYYSGFVDTLLMGISDVFVLLPPPVALLIFGLLVRMEWPVMAVLYGVLVGLGTQALVVKSQALTLRVKPYIEAAKIAGGGDFHILLKHIFPGILPLAIVNFFLTVVGAVLIEALLSFFNRTTVDLSWGMMIWIGQESFRRHTLLGQWHAIVPPALALTLFCSAFYLVGRALDDVVNPRLQGR